jgi:hypothetical protein
MGAARWRTTRRQGPLHGVRVRRPWKVLAKGVDTSYSGTYCALWRGQEKLRRRDVYLRPGLGVGGEAYMDNQSEVRALLVVDALEPPQPPPPLQRKVRLPALLHVRQVGGGG